MNTLLKTFPYEYVGGGYFRLKGVPKNTSAPIIHGEKIMQEFLLHIIGTLTPEEFAKLQKENLTSSG